ncbi:peptidoglycan DD-metalloendopeptidase family protein [Enemella sp. A6]|uniref:peptidoglycan DD-metalloendopeptidase family protein n=1 Tax=Enemella sp. A6 TaxID=3440152 RepID=UPI003EBEEB17
MKRELPFTRVGDPKNSKTLARLLTAIVALLISTSLIAPAAADDLDDERERVGRELAQTQRDLGASDQKLGQAAAALQQAEADLSAARAELQRTREALAVAQAHDEKMAQKLAKAEAELERAKAKVEEGQRKLDAEQEMVGNVARHSYQNRADLMPIAVLVQDDSMSNMQTRMQWSNTMQQATEADMERLRELKRKLDADKAKKEAIEAKVAEERKAAAEALSASEALEAQAAQQEAVVTERVNQHAAAKTQAEQAVAKDKARYEALSAERASVEKRIAERIARQKAEAARKAAEKRAREAAARQAAAKAREAEARRKAAASKAPVRRAAAAPSRTTTRSAASRPAARSSSSSSSGGGGGLVRPVSGPITSPFGMRLHPVLGYWKLHDGMDYGAACGTPIRAAAAGRVTEQYYNGGYGNRVMIDHGKVNGRYLSTSYNHLSRYAVRTGSRVQKGQVIGYVGNTGYSTGCHLHYMTWVNGKLVNPWSLY